MISAPGPTADGRPFSHRSEGREGIQGSSADRVVG